MKPVQCVLICLVVTCLPSLALAAPRHNPTKKPTVSAWTTVQHQSAMEALKSLRKLHVATSIGVTCADYQNRVIDAASDVTETLRTVPAGTIHNEIAGSLQAYVDAATVWQKSQAAITALLAITDQGSQSFAKIDDTFIGFSADPDIVSIGVRYSLPKAELAPAAYQHEYQLVNEQMEAATQAAKAGASWDEMEAEADRQNDVIDELKKESRRDILNTYTKSALATIWQLADNLEQKADALNSSVK